MNTGKVTLDESWGLLTELEAIRGWLTEQQMKNEDWTYHHNLALNAVQSYFCHFSETPIRYRRVVERIRKDLLAYYQPGGPLDGCPFTVDLP